MSRRLLVVRHAVAESREDFAQTGADDEHRPLTVEGRRRMKQAVVGLQALVPDVGALCSSPLRRALQTAEVLSAEYATPVRPVDVLRPDATPDAWLEWFRAIRGDDVTIVGHEPHLSSLVTWLIGGGFRSAIILKKGGVAMVEFDDDGPARAGGARLSWLMTPAQLRALGS